MGCYMYPNSPVSSLMDRRRSFPRVNSRDSGKSTIDIDFTSSLYNDESPTPMINEYFSAKLQELDLGHRHFESGGSLDQLYFFHRYRSPSPCPSSNSSQSSRRQSFSSTTSNSCCNQSSSNGVAINYSCGDSSIKNSQGQSPSSPYQNSPGSKKFCASLLRARLLNMSEQGDDKRKPRERARRSRTPRTPTDSQDGHDNDHDNDQVPEAEPTNRPRRQTESSEVSDVESDREHRRKFDGESGNPDYPAVGMHGKKRRMLEHQRRLSESTDADQDSFEESPSKRRSESGAGSTETQSVQQQPINLCTQDKVNLAVGGVERLKLDSMDTDRRGPFIIHDEDEETKDDQGQSTESWVPHDRATYHDPGGELNLSLPGPSGYSKFRTRFGSISEESGHVDSEQAGTTSASFYGTDPGPGPSNLYQDGTVTNPQIPTDSPSSSSTHHQPPNSGRRIVPLPPQDYDVVTLPENVYRYSRTAQQDRLTESQAQVARQLNLEPFRTFNIDPLSTNYAIPLPRFSIGLDDSHSLAHLQDMSRAHARDSALAEFRQTELEDALMEQAEATRMNQRDRMRASQLRVYEHRSEVEFGPGQRPPPPLISPRSDLLRQELQPALNLRANPDQEAGQGQSAEMPMAEAAGCSQKKGTGKSGAAKKPPAPKKVLQCPDCPKVFSQLRNFRYHRSRHEGTDLFQCTCPVCGKRFNDKGYLSSHLKIHANEKEYQCEFCVKSFNQRVAYNMHVRIHTGVKPHHCPHCEKAFSRKMLLRQHTRTHTGERPYKCSLCSKAFADRSNMLLHQKLHSGNRPYACTQCDKTFSKNHHLKTHMNHHLGIKPYTCTNCGHNFSQSSNMKTHMKKCKATTSPSVSASKTPGPGKTANASPADPNKKKRGRKPKIPPSATVTVDENSQISAPAPSSSTPMRTDDDFLAENVIQTRDRAMSMDSNLRPTVIQVTKTRYKLRNPDEWTGDMSESTHSLPTYKNKSSSRTKSGTATTTVPMLSLSPAIPSPTTSGRSRTDPRVNRSLQDLHRPQLDEQFQFQRRPFTDPNAQNPPQNYMVSGRRYSDYSPQAAALRTHHDSHSMEPLGRQQMQMSSPAQFGNQIIHPPYQPHHSVPLPNQHPMTSQSSHHQMTSQHYPSHHDFAVRAMYQHNPRVGQPAPQVPQFQVPQIPPQNQPRGQQMYHQEPGGPQLTREAFVARMEHFQMLELNRQMGLRGVSTEFNQVEQRQRSQSFRQPSRQDAGFEGQRQRQPSLPTSVERPRNRSPAQAARLAQQGQGHHLQQQGVPSHTHDSGTPSTPHRVRSYSESGIQQRHPFRYQRQEQHERRERFSDPAVPQARNTRNRSRSRSRSRSPIQGPEEGRCVQVKEEVYFELLAAEQAEADDFVHEQALAALALVSLSPEDPSLEFEQEIKLMEAFKLSSPASHVSEEVEVQV